MTYGELKEYVLQLLNSYSVAGREVAVTYNDQADLLARIPALTRDGLYYVTTTVRRLRTAAVLNAPAAMGDLLIYDLPEDCFQLCGGLWQVQGGEARRIRTYQLLGGRQVLLPGTVRGTILAEYFRYPAVPEGNPADEAVLDCPPEALSAVACYVAAHLAMEDNNYLYTALYKEFETKMLRLREGLQPECGVTEDVYGEGT